MFDQTAGPHPTDYSSWHWKFNIVFGIWYGSAFEIINDTLLIWFSSCFRGHSSTFLSHCSFFFLDNSFKYGYQDLILCFSITHSFFTIPYTPKVSVSPVTLRLCSLSLWSHFLLLMRASLIFWKIWMYIFKIYLRMTFLEFPLLIGLIGNSSFVL